MKTPLLIVAALAFGGAALPVAAHQKITFDNVPATYDGVSHVVRTAP